MTWGTDTKTVSPDAIVQGAPSVGVDPGKRPKTLGPTGVPVVDEGLACDADHANGVGASCTLTATQRDNASRVYGQRVLAARDAFLHACTLVEVQKLLETEPENPIMMIVVNALGGFLLGQLAGALLNFKTSLQKDPIAAMVIAHETERIDKLTNAVNVGESVANPMSLREKALTKFEGLNETKLEAKLEVGIDKAKEFATKTNEKKAAVEARTEKMESQEYLGSVRSLGETTFTSFAEDLPAGATDVELVGLINVFASERHTVDKYITAIGGKLDRFKQSQITKIGRRNATHVESDGKADIPAGDAIRDVKVQWQTYMSGYAKDLVFVHQDGARDTAGYHADDPDSPEFKQPGPKTFGPHAPMGAVAKGVGPRHDDRFIIDAEFWDVALERHRAAWGTEPETVVVDDSAFDWDPKRQQAAKIEKYKLTQAQIMADHAASIALSNQQAMEHAKKTEPKPQGTIVVPAALKLDGGLP